MGQYIEVKVVTKVSPVVTFFLFTGRKCCHSKVMILPYVLSQVAHFWICQTCQIDSLMQQRQIARATSWLVDNITDNQENGISTNGISTSNSRRRESQPMTDSNPPVKENTGSFDLKIMFFVLIVNHKPIK